LASITYTIKHSYVVFSMPSIQCNHDHVQLLGPVSVFYGSCSSSYFHRVILYFRAIMTVLHKHVVSQQKFV